MARKQWRLDSVVDCGYIPNMEDRRRSKDSMVHVRFTEEERRQLKAHCALQGMSMQEYIRAVVLKKLVRQKKRRDK
jgi:predicted DNA binding CopG/RHH family protein